ncbi:hypothetical protein HDU99_006763, partial [Rhizoclosmatium hyalinum]
TMIMISNSVAPSYLGSAFGLSATCAAVVKTLAPPLSGAAWEFATMQMKSPWLAFGVIHIVGLASIGIALIFRPAVSEKKEKKE